MSGVAELVEGGTILSEGLVLAEATSAIGKVEVPKKGKLFEEDGSCAISIIRPCVSRGKRLRGLPPIYTPAMLAEDAGVFGGWLMYMDHLTERIVEMLQERGRSITELGGRILKSYYDPNLVFEDDADFGYQKGGVRARCIPQPAVRSMLEADPGILHVSINAYPRAVREGVAPWDSSLKGMLIEGIRSKPPGSVDWVPRGGAGGRPLMEWEDAAVSMLESYYDAPRGRQTDMPEWKNMTKDQLAEALRSENPELAKTLGLAESSSGSGGSPTLPARVQESAPTLTLEQVEAKLAEQARTFEQKLAEKDAELEEAVDDRLAERDEARQLAKDAHGLIEAAKLKPSWEGDLKRRWDVFPSGPSPALTAIIERATAEKPAKDLLKEAVDADLEHAADLIAEAAGDRRPRVSGLGGGGSLKEQNGGKPPVVRNAFRDFLKESGDSFGDKPEDFESGLREMVREGVTA